MLWFIVIHNLLTAMDGISKGKDMNLNALKKYECDSKAISEGKEFVLERGLKAVLKPYGMNNFYKSYLEHAKGMQGLSEEVDFESTNYALANTIIVSLGEGEDKIVDKKVLFEVLNNTCYFALRNEILAVARQSEQFASVQVEEIKKDLQPT